MIAKLNLIPASDFYGNDDEVGKAVQVIKDLLQFQ